MPVDARAAEIVALLNRINDLLVEFTATSSAKRQAAVKAELEAATDKLKRVAFSFQN
jgi:flagellin-like hook-associated protein FlgL